ncbi:MAG: hypothetical protein HN350_19500 [Phycisphaerales bacterium]|jgi:hypothetical protein|nr:hypothetical protein [Phycisphaerales bacterium]
MFELIVMFMAVSAMAKLAAGDDRSSLLWGTITTPLSLLFIFTIPLPFLRILFALIATFILMVVCHSTETNNSPKNR